MNKLGKIAPIVVIVACLGSLYFVFKISGQKKDMKDQIAGLTTDKQQLEANLGSAKKDLSTTKTALAKTTEDLNLAVGNLSATQVKLTEKTQEADGLTAKLADTTKELDQAKLDRDAAQNTLTQITNALAATGVNLADLEQIKTTIVAQGEENKILGKQLLAMKQQITELTTTPDGLRGRVAAVQDSWGFVVLDIGRNQRVAASSQFVVYRDSKMVGKVQILSVGPTTSVAEILPGFQGNPPRVGDTVIH